MTDQIAKEIALSATIVLLRPSRDAASPGVEVLMVQRAATMGFAARALVFPGGKVDPCDEGHTDPDEVDYRFPLGVARLAATRELFEETGILLVCDRQGMNGVMHAHECVSDWMEWRQQSNQQAEVFYDKLAHLDLKPNIKPLLHFASWRTPPQLKRRFETHFFVMVAPEDQEAIIDGEESTEAIWARPADFLAMAERDEKKIILPTRRNLELLSQFDNVEAVIEDARQRPKPMIEPTVETIDGEQYAVIPEDIGYPVTRERLKTALRD